MTEYYYRVTMEDGSQYDVPYSIILESHDGYYKNKRPDDFEPQDINDPECRDNLTDWACNNMNWSEVEHVAVKVKDAEISNLQEGWCNGEHEWVQK